MNADHWNQHRPHNIEPARIGYMMLLGLEPPHPAPVFRHGAPVAPRAPKIIPPKPIPEIVRIQNIYRMRPAVALAWMSIRDIQGQFHAGVVAEKMRIDTKGAYQAVRNLVVRGLVRSLGSVAQKRGRAHVHMTLFEVAPDAWR